MNNVQREIVSRLMCIREKLKKELDEVQNKTIEPSESFWMRDDDIIERIKASVRDFSIQAIDRGLKNLDESIGRIDHKILKLLIARDHIESSIASNGKKTRSSIIPTEDPEHIVTLLEYEIIGDATEVYLKHLDKINQMIKKEIEQ